MALIARHGPDWFRGLGSAVAAGERAGDPRRRGRGARRLRDRVRQPAGRRPAPRGRRHRAPAGRSWSVGYFGTWLDAQHMGDLTLSEGDLLLSAGVDRGRGALGPAGRGTCGVQEAARVAGLPRRRERRSMRTVRLRPARHCRQLPPSGAWHRGPGRGDAAAALGSRCHRPRRLPPSRRRVRASSPAR